MEDNTLIFLALFDFVPNIAFLIGAYFLVRIGYMLRNKNCSSLIIVGTFLILLGGFLQAIWKLLYSTGADIRFMSNLQFIILAPGFVILLAAVIMLLRRSTKKISSPLLAIALWKIPFLIVMVVASLATQSLLAFISFRRHAVFAGIGFIIALICLLAMGGMASGEQTLAMQWIEESINSIGQISFATASFLLFRNYKANPC